MASATGFAIPDLATLKQRSEGAINAFLPGADARLRRSVLNVIATVMAGMTHGLYGHQNFIATTALPSMASDEYLEAWCNIWGIRRKPAANAVGNVTFTGVVGAVIPQGTAVQRGDGVVYRTAIGVTMAGSTAAVAVEADEPGLNGNAAAAVAVTLVSPLGDVQTEAVVAVGGITGGADTEGDDSLRERLLDRIQNPPHGGTKEDYERWALEVPGVTRAWCSPQELGPGTNTVRFAMDATYDDGIPLSADVDAVQAYIDERRPTTAELFVVAPEATALNITVTGLSPDTPEIRAAVLAELDDMFKRDGEPGGTIYISRIWEAVALAAGERHHRITSPANDTAFTTNQLPVRGVVTFA